MARASISRMHDFSLRAMMAICIGIYIALILLLSISIPESPFLVGLGFLPVLLYLAIIFTLLRMHKSMVELVYILPIVLNILYYLVWSLNVIPELAGMEGGILAMMNLVVSYVFAVILSFVHPFSGSAARAPRPKPVRRSAPVKEAAPAKQQLDEKKVKTTIRAIEDKCKAINFVVGRVYSNKKGGSKSIREKIVIPRELYNSFSELTEDEETGAYDKLKLLSVVENIYARLKRLTHPERELFDILPGKLPVQRSPDGSDRILDVLTKNDKDPVEDYYNAAVGVCEQVVEYLRKTN